MSVALLLALALAAPPPPPPWDAPPFTADPAALAAAAAALPAPEGDAELDVLLEEGTWSFDEAGRATVTFRLVYRPLTREAAQAWGRVRRDWAPWHQERPEIRARVVLPSGAVRTLDPATLVEAGIGEDGEEIYTDRRSLRGPLPAMEPGALVEETSTVRDLAPSFAAGSAWRFYFGWGPPTRLARLRVEAPASLPLHHLARGLKLRPRERVEAGRRTLVFERSPSPPAAAREPWLPPEDAAAPHVAFSTGRSWAEVAAAYAEVVERRLAGGLPEALREAVSPGEPPERAAQRALDWIGKRLRYTGLELGEAAIVPATPAETLARGYGDCKDLSLVLAAILRAGGHRATLALVRSRWDELPAELPGIGEFDHAIVHVGGARPFFVDPTDPDVPAGELPVGDQGRRALVAERGTRALVTTPESGPARNRLRIVRELALAETARCKASEEREARGLPAADLRHERRGIAPEKLREGDEGEARRLLNAEGDVRTVATGLDAVAGPVTLRREADRSGWAITREHEADAVVSPAPVFELLPSFLRPEPPEGDEDAKQEKEKKKAEPRKSPLALPVAFAATLEYRVEPPAGFRAALPLPPDRTEKMGPATFTARYSVAPSGAVLASYAFELPRRRLTAAEAAALAAGVAPITTVDGPHVRFERTAAALLAAGKGREGLAEIRRLIGREPKKARHRIHLALALLELGLGDAARAEARAAVALAPAEGWPHRVLGHVLEHDALGRPESPGCDLAGAIAAQRRAVELEKTGWVRAGLARLLRQGTDCSRYGPGARLEEAAAEFAAARREGDTGSAAEELEVALRAGRFDQAAEVARAVKDVAGREAALVAAAAVKDGARAALDEATRLAPQDRGQVVSQAYLHLMRARRYPLAVALLEQVAGPKGQGLDVLRRLRRHEELKLDPADAKALPARLLLALLSADEPKALAAVVSARAPEAARSDLVRGIRAGFKVARDQVDLPREVMADSTLVSLDTEADCVPRAACRLGSTSPYAKQGFQLLAVWERDGWRLLSDRQPAAELGAVARARLDAGDAPGARKLLGWAREQAGEPDPDGFLASGALERLAPKGREPAEPELRLALLALEARSALPGPAVKPLQAALASAGPAPRRAIQWSLADAFVTLERFADALAVADGILAETPDAEQAVTLKALMLSALGRRADARAALAARLRDRPGDRTTARMLAQLAAEEGDFALQRSLLAPLVASGDATAVDYNQLAWGALFVEPLAPGALDEARRAVDLSRSGGAAELHTLASLLAASGQPAEAVQVLRKALEARGGAAPEPYDWLVVGQVAEYYGLLDAAAAAYRRVTPGERATAMDSHRLAQARLRRVAP